MKRIFFLSVLFFLVTINHCCGQLTEIKTEPKTAVTIGFLQGGGALVGADFEFMVGETFGIQLGAGYIGYGFGINMHFSPTVRSSAISLQYWNQGTGETYVQSVVGLNYMLRLKKILQAQIGVGRNFEFTSRGIRNPGWLLMYAIGIYMPL